MLRLAPAIGLAVGVLATVPAQADQITVFAAASLKTALDAIASEFQAATGHDIAVSYAGSSVLARQIAHGAPADIFVSASPDWMDVLARDGLIDSDSRFDLLGNAMVVVAHDPRPRVDTVTGPDLVALVGSDRVAMALVDAVPAGVYGKAALVSLGAWDSLAGQVVQSDNVRSALALVSTGEAPFGIVYATDARADPDVTVVVNLPADSHPPIVYPAALVADARPVAAGFLDFLRGEVARALFVAEGFTVIGD